MHNSLGDLHTFDAMVRNSVYGNTDHSKQVNIKAFQIINVILLRQVSSDVNYTKLVWLFCTDGKSFSIYSQCWYFLNTLCKA